MLNNRKCWHSDTWGHILAAHSTHLSSPEGLCCLNPLNYDLFSFLSSLSTYPSPWETKEKQIPITHILTTFWEKTETSQPAVLTWSLCLCLLFFLFVVCLLRSGTIRGDGRWSELGWGLFSGLSGSSCAQGVGSSLLATSSSCWQTADRESNNFRGSSEFFFPSSTLASMTSLWAACLDGLNLDLSLGVLLDKWDILGFLLASGSVYSSGRECFGRCAGEELGVSRSGLTWASGTVRRFCCGWNSLLHKKWQWS